MVKMVSQDEIATLGWFTSHLVANICVAEIKAN